MSYVQRSGGNIVGLYALLQPGFAEEFLADNSPEVLAFLNPPLLPRIVTDSAEVSAAKIDGTIITLINQSRADWQSWATANLPTLTAPERNRMGTILWVVSLAIRGQMR